MISDKKIISLARQSLLTEASSVSDLSRKIGKNFIKSIKIMLFSQGRIIITGIGKSALIAQKIVATFNSTGTPAVFMHAADAVHGDLGIIQKKDVVVCISNSGNTPEIKILVPIIKSGGNKLIAITGDEKSFLALHAEAVLNASVKKEACPMNLAPTSSSMAQLALGHTLAICLLECRGFTKSDFARFHPGGALGKKLYLKVSDIYLHNACPVVSENDNLKKVIYKISSGRLGAAAVVNKNKVKGIITDGDLRRMLESGNSIDKVKAKDIMTRKPKSVPKDMLAAEAFQLMKSNNITQVLVTENDKLLGFVHLHDLLREGIF